MLMINRLEYKKKMVQMELTVDEEWWQWTTIAVVVAREIPAAPLLPVFWFLRQWVDETERGEVAAGRRGCLLAKTVE